MKRKSFEVLFVFVALVLAVPSLVRGNCRSKLVDDAPTPALRAAALEYFVARGRGEANRAILADFLEEHFGRVPGVHVAAARLRAPTLYSEGDEEATAFWRAAGILPLVDGAPTRVVALTYDGFPVVPVGVDYFYSDDRDDLPWLTDVIVGLPSTHRREFTFSERRRPRLLRLRSARLAPLFEHLPGDPGFPSHYAAHGSLLSRMTGLWEIAAPAHLLPHLSALLPQTLQVVRVLDDENPEATDTLLWQDPDDVVAPVAHALSERARMLGEVLSSLPALSALQLDGTMMTSALPLVRRPLRALQLGTLGPDTLAESSEVVAERLSRFKQLEELEIQSADSSAVLARLPTGLRRLRALYHGGSETRWLQRLRKLEYLGLAHSSDDTERLVRALPTTLQTLILTGLSLGMVNPQADRALASRLGRLSRLTRVELDFLSFPEALASLPHGVEHLRLSISRRPDAVGSVNPVLARVFARLENLRRLDLELDDFPETALPAFDKLPRSTRALSIAVHPNANEVAVVHDVLTRTLARPEGHLLEMGLRNLRPDPEALVNLAQVLTAGTTLETLHLGVRRAEGALRQAMFPATNPTRQRLATSFRALASLRRLVMPVYFVDGPLMNALSPRLLLLELTQTSGDPEAAGLSDAMGRRFLRLRPNFRALVTPQNFSRPEDFDPYWMWHPYWGR